MKMILDFTMIWKKVIREEKVFLKNILKSRLNN
jgi:hypothetical protein